MTRRSRLSAAGRAATLALPALLACSNAGEDLGFGSLATGSVTGFVFLDRDGSLGPAPTPGLDTILAGVRVGIVTLGTNDTVASGLTDAQGLVTLTSVPLGDYRMVVDTTTIGDTVEVQGFSADTLQLRATVLVAGANVRVGYPAVTTGDVRTLTAGTRVFVKGVVLAGVTAFRDTTAYILDAVRALRLTNVRNIGFPQANVAGDSVRVLGTIATRNGQPVLDSARVYTFGGQNPPVAVSLTTLQAAGADGGIQDAALVQLTGAVIQDTATVAPDYRVVVDDGSGPMDLLLDGNINFQRGLFLPGKSITGKGILVPQGGGVWAFKPRAVNDITIN